MWEATGCTVGIAALLLSPLALFEVAHHVWWRSVSWEAWGGLVYAGVSLEEHLAINLFGPYDVTQAFLPLLIRSRGAVVNNLSMNALAPMPLVPGYSAAKAAAFSLTQSSRILFARQGVSVHAVLTGPVDTDAARGFDMPKASPESVARAIFDGVENEEEDIFPDPMSQSLAESWRNGSAKGLERMLAAYVGAQPVKP
jgi:NAD(P)-dependent dehydrogenase (short-subunit alcohol dehydrogenase family)